MTKKFEQETNVTFTKLPTKLFHRYKVTKNTKSNSVIKESSYFKDVWNKLIHNWVFDTGLLLLVIIVLMAIFVPLGHEPIPNPTLRPSYLPADPSWNHWFGLGPEGEDFWIECWAGLNTTLWFALVITLIEIGLGILIGFIWGYFHKSDILLMQITNILMMLPTFIMTTIVILITEPNFWPIVFAISLQSWIGFAYMVRNQIMFCKNYEFNIASRVLGSSHAKIITKNIFPTILPIIVQAIAFSIPSAISMDAFINFLNIGFVDGSHVTSLGFILKKIVGDTSYYALYPSLVIAPVTMIIAVGFIFFLIAKIVADTLNVRSNR
ncbi:MAG: ABC transporter permease [Mycoplasmataceae bacterium]|nr:ABC transporter permease [Mycoplasmataceae bacterium]